MNYKTETEIHVLPRPYSHHPGYNKHTLYAWVLLLFLRHGRQPLLKVTSCCCFSVCNVSFSIVRHPYTQHRGDGQMRSVKICVLETVTGAGKGQRNPRAFVGSPLLRTLACGTLRSIGNHLYSTRSLIISIYLMFCLINCSYESLKRQNSGS